MNSNSIIDWVNSRLDNINLYGGSSNDEIIANCPFCRSRKGSEDHKQHLYINKYNNLAHCFRCGWKGNWISLVMELDGCTYTEAVLILSSRSRLEEFGDVLNKLKNKTAATLSLKFNAKVFPDDYVTLEDQSYSISKMALKYLRSRNISEYFIHSGMFGIVPSQLRLYISASDNYWQARALNSYIQPKYLNPGIDVNDILGVWDISELREYNSSLSDSVYVCEGIFSALAVMQHGYSAVALLGKTIRPAQLQRLIKINKHIVVMLDADAVEESWQVAKACTEAGRSEVSVAILKHGDPEECFKYELYPADWKHTAMWKVRSV